jgi:hypothetical protein
LRDFNSIVIFSVGFPFPFKNNKNGSLFLFYKIESWKGKKQRNAKIKSKEKLAHLGGCPAKPHGLPAVASRP